MIAENLQKLINIKSDIKNAINGKGGSVGERFEDYAPAIENLPSGGGALNPFDLGEDTIFVDFTGDVLFKASPEEIMEWTDFSAVPVPNHSDMNLRFVKWTHSIDELKDGTWHDVGALYESTDGTTVQFDILGEPGVEQSIALTFDAVGSLTVNWGDATIDVYTATSVSQVINARHTYSEKGQYTVKFSGVPIRRIEPSTPTAGKITGTLIIGGGNAFYSGTTLYTDTVVVLEDIKIFPAQYLYTAKALIINTENLVSPLATANKYAPNARFIIMKNYASFDGIYYNGNDLQTLSVDQSLCQDYAASTKRIPNSKVLQRVQFRPNSLAPAINAIAKNIKIIKNYKLEPSQTTMPGNMGDSWFLELVNSEDAFDHCTTFSSAGFRNCRKIKYLKFSNLTNIPNRVFEDCVSLETIDFSGSTAVPTLASTGAFLRCSAKFLIPDALYDTWIAATNWATMYALAPNRFVRV